MLIPRLKHKSSKFQSKDFDSTQKTEFEFPITESVTPWVAVWWTILHSSASPKRNTLQSEIMKFGNKRELWVFDPFKLRNKKDCKLNPINQSQRSK